MALPKPQNARAARRIDKVGLGVFFAVWLLFALLLWLPLFENGLGSFSRIASAVAFALFLGGLLAGIAGRGVHFILTLFVLRWEEIKNENP